MGNASGKDRREFERIPVHKQVDLEPVDDDGRFQSELLDVSLKGLLVRQPDQRPVRKGERFGVTIHLSDNESIQLAGEVAHSEPDRAGIEWTHIESEGFAHLRRLLEVNLGDSDEIKREIDQLAHQPGEPGHDDEQPDKHMAGEGHAHHQFNPERAAEFHDEERLNRLRPKQLLDKLDVGASDQILDLGTDSGALLSDCSARVNEGVVIGADISEPMLDQARTEVEQASLHNVVLTKNTPTELPLITDTQDAVLIVSSLHEFSDPVTMLAEVGRVLKPGGRLGIVEWRHGETEEGPPKDHRLAPETIENWLTEAGLKPLSQEEWTDTGYDLYVAEKA